MTGGGITEISRQPRLKGSKLSHVATTRLTIKSGNLDDLAAACAPAGGLSSEASSSGRLHSEETKKRMRVSAAERGAKKRAAKETAQ